MKKQLMATAAAAGLALAGLTAPAVADVPLTFNLGYGQWYFDGKRDLDGGRDLKDSSTPWGSIEWAFNDTVAAEIFYADGDTRYKNGPDVDATAWSLNMLFYGGSYVGKPMRLRPYAVLGAGEIYLDADAFDTKETTINGGLGVRWMLTRRFGVRLDWRMLYGLDESTKDSMLTAGLNLYTGRVTPKPVPVAAPLDSDGDGVTDDVDQCPNTPAGVRVDNFGCPLAVTQIASIKLMVNFGFDSTKVEEKYFSDLGELAEFLKRFEDVQVDVEGHTDSVGPDDYNKELSQRRAQAVVDMLVDEYGIAPQRLEAVGYGEEKPVADNSTAEGRAENRRVMATLEVEYEE
jgi:OOP family OmpA-OmpF porin